MKQRLVIAATLTLFAMNPAYAESFYCARYYPDAFLSSTGKLGIFLPAPLGEKAEYTEVEPGECFYDGALRDMKEMCALINDLPESRPPADGGDDSSVEDPIEDEFTPELGQPDSLKPIRNLMTSIAKLKKRVRTLRRKLHRRGA